MSDETLQLLIQGCLQEDRRSQEKLYQRFYPYGMSVCLRYTNSHEEAIEVLNDGFMKVFTSLERFDEHRAFHTWFRKILINTAINYYHKHKKHRQHESIEQAHPLAAEQDMLSQLSYQEMIRLVQTLSPAYRAVFNLYAIDGYSHEEIAEALNISVGASKSNLSRARAHLRSLIKRNHETCKI